MLRPLFAILRPAARRRLHTARRRIYTDSFLNATNTRYLEEVQRQWEENPESVDKRWDDFFRDMENDQGSKNSVASDLEREYEEYGHWRSKLDPLGLNYEKKRDYIRIPEHIEQSKIKRLEKMFCGTIGYEYMHIVDKDKREWIKNKIQQASETDQEMILEHLARSTLFEKFLEQKWGSQKRFGLDGCESLIPGMMELFETSGDLGVETVVIGMPHRGRLNVLANVVGKPYRQIFQEFQGSHVPHQGAGSGDVKYHLGASCDRILNSGKMLHISLLANPSHLEAVDPVVLGKTKAKQVYSEDVDQSKNMAVLLHGDGSFSGQGVVYETLQLCSLQGYGTGGTVHIVVNNQIAFTTNPSSSHSSERCTDIAKVLGIPIFHVNGDDVEAVVRVCKLAAEWRSRFKSDVVIDIVCYRRNGHNEGDMPSFTQPKMYQVIEKHPATLSLYEDKLVASGAMSLEDVSRVKDKIMVMLMAEFENSKDFKPDFQNFTSRWSPKSFSLPKTTAVKIGTLKEVGRKITTVPPDFTPHKTVKRNFEQRAQMMESGRDLDWAMGETLAYATLLNEGVHVRLSGQDVERGTFSHRHAILHDQETGATYCPLKNVDQEKFSVSNSSLSEFGVLGFELGYSMENPNSLACWEAQFGDFANGAQVIFDQFLSSGEAKWIRQSGLVVMLPHGYEGQGPEHSSARLERFLQMSNDNPFVISDKQMQVQACNWQVVNVTTPANYFHVLRRQVHREFRKPLIVMSPKKLLRHKLCRSNLSEFKEGTYFQRLIKDKNHRFVEVDDKIRRLILCSGKIYYDLEEQREKQQASDVAICRVEQLCPLPHDLLQKELLRYPNAEVVWCQEEPMNMGGFSYVAPRLATTMASVGRGKFEDIRFVGRPPSASTSTGFGVAYSDQEQAELVSKALKN